MHADSPSALTGRRRWWRTAGRTLIWLALLAVGLCVQHWPIIRNGFSGVHGNLGDARLINILLEHSYKCLFGASPLSLYWNPPWIFYPHPNVLAYSDVLTGALLPYAPWRLLGWEPMRAYQAWFFCSSILNYAAFFCLLRYLGQSFLGALLGAFVFAFVALRVGFMGHPQLLPEYPLVIALICGAAYVQAASAPRRILALVAGALCVAWQLWIGFYLAWFFCLLAAVGGALLLLTASTRRRCLARIKADWRAWGAAALALGCACQPLARHYLATRAEMGSRDIGEVIGFMPHPWAWLLSVRGSFLYHRLFDLLFPQDPWAAEMYMFPGLLTWAAPVALLLLHKRWRAVLPSSLPFIPVLVPLLTVIAMLLPLRIGDWGPWRLVYLTVPGATAVRAVGRIVIVALIGYGFSVGLVLTALERRLGGRWRILVPLLAVLVIVENLGINTYAFDIKDHEERVSALTARLEAQPGCRVFYDQVTDTFWKDQIDAMWVSLETGIPTINGYSGVIPSRFSALGLFERPRLGRDAAWEWLKNERAQERADQVCVISLAE